MLSEPEDMPVLLGDIVICPAVAFRNAPEHAGNYDDEVALLVVHGLLHLMGMDHEDAEEAEEMESKERELLARHYAEIRPEAWRAKPAGTEPSGPAKDGSAPEQVRNSVLGAGDSSSNVDGHAEGPRADGAAGAD